MFYIVYETKNNINGKLYRGIHQTEDLCDGYIGSGIAIGNAIRKYGKENFSREILEFCSYDELIEKEKLYVTDDWVRDHNNYNLKTGGQSAGILSDESKKKISETLKRKYANGEIKVVVNSGYTMSEDVRLKISETLKERYLTEDHVRKGKEPWNKDLKGSQNAWNKGLKMESLSEEHKSKISETLKERYKNVEHHSKGKPFTGRTTKGMPSWNKGLKREKISCPYCGKMSDISNGKRWHFDNCKYLSKDIGLEYGYCGA